MSIVKKYVCECECGMQAETTELDMTGQPFTEVVIDLNNLEFIELKCEYCGRIYTIKGFECDESEMEGYEEEDDE